MTGRGIFFVFVFLSFFAFVGELKIYLLIFFDYRLFKNGFSFEKMRDNHLYINLSYL